MSTCSRRKPAPALRASAATASNFTDALSPTPQQKLRGHGEGGWKEAGYDLQTGTVTTELRNLVLTYGELAQATYDNLGLDPCTPATYGTTVEPPAEMLKYLDENYPLAAGAPPSGRVATGSLYRLPVKGGNQDVDKGGDQDVMSPLLFALPGKPSASRQDTSWTLQIVDTLFTTTTQVLANLIDSNNGGRTLFRELTANGRKKMGRGAFIGYIAVSEPSGPHREVDVAIVWRGTIFKEEWESNFVQNELDEWTADVKGRAAELCGTGDCQFPELRPPVTPDPADVGVHDGFQDLYDRPIDQAWPLADQRTLLSPRQAVHKWLKQLMNEHNVTTITTTGHSLGGGLSTLCAYDVGGWLQKQWEDSNNPEGPFKVTKAMPKVTCISFAAPRVGNATFGEQYRALGVKALRVVNKGDVVPEIPGFLVQFWTNVLDKTADVAPWFVSPRSLLDMESTPISLVRNLSKWYSIACAKVNKDWRSRWGYWHVGQVLELDIDNAAAGVLPLDKETRKPDVGTAQRHNLELYLYLVSLLKDSSGGSGTGRNPLLMNKSDDVLADKDKIPANWWGAAGKRGFTKVKGRWVAPVTTTSKP